MPIYFLDSSAVAKRYVAETGSGWVAGIMHPSAGNQLQVAGISGVEVMAAIAKRMRSGNLSQQAAREATSQFRADFGRIQDVVEISPQVITRAMDLVEKHALRGYDAVQLASALIVHEAATVIGLSVILVSADDELNAAALTEGLQVENPSLHP
jgi:hypothetical protein